MKTVSLRVLPMLAMLAALGACATTGGGARSMVDGAWILAEWTDGYFYPGVLQGRGDGGYNVIFDDGTEATLRSNQIRVYDWQIGTPIACQLIEGQMTAVTISTMGPEATDLGVLDETGTLSQTSTGRCVAL